DGAWAEITDLRLESGHVQRDVRGADLSGIPKNEAHGAEYFSADGSVSVDPVEVFAEHGATMGRLRVWVDPADGFCTPEHTVAMARRISQAGMEVLIDFHYSDTWTDPGAQGVPSAWLPDAPEGLTDAVAEHTRSTLLAIRDAGVDVAAVQVGNEINPGMLWPWGQTWDVDPDDGVDGARYDDLARFLTAGSLAVTEVFPAAEVMLHLTNIHDGVDGLTSWFDEIVRRDVPFDVIGLSYYSYWHGTLMDLQRAISTLADRYERDVIVVETAYAFTLEDDPDSPFENIVAEPSQLAEGYPASPEGQAAAFRAVQDVTVSAPSTGGRGRGAVYWEPAGSGVTVREGIRRTPRPEMPGRTRPCSTSTGICSRLRSRPSADRSGCLPAGHGRRGSRAPRRRHQTGHASRYPVGHPQFTACSSPCCSFHIGSMRSSALLRAGTRDV